MGLLLEVFRLLATVLNTAMYMSPAPTAYAIYRSKATGHMPFVPLAAMAANAHVWTVYGWLVQDYVAMFGTCTFGLAVAILYVSIYYRYTAETAYTHKCIAVFGLIIVVNSLYAIMGANGVAGQSYDAVGLTVGYIGDALSIIMYSSPFEKIRLVVKHRSGVFIPIQIVAVGALNSATWVVYSLLGNDWLVFGPNAFMMTFGIAQIAVYWAFHPVTHPLPEGGLPSVVLTRDFITTKSPSQPLESV